MDSVGRARGRGRANLFSLGASAWFETLATRFLSLA